MDGGRKRAANYVLNERVGGGGVHAQAPVAGLGILGQQLWRQMSLEGEMAFFLFLPPVVVQAEVWHFRRRRRRHLGNWKTTRNIKGQDGIAKAKTQPFPSFSSALSLRQCFKICSAAKERLKGAFTRVLPPARPGRKAGGKGRP